MRRSSRHLTLADTQLLSGQLDNFQYVRRGSRTINHAYPQCHFLCGQKALLEPESYLFVGQLERYVVDVARLIAALGFAPSQRAALLNASVERSNFAKRYPRESSNATRYAVATAAATRAVEMDEVTRAAVCHLLHIDHACINGLLPAERRYARPAACAAVPVATGTHAADAATKPTTKPEAEPTAGRRLLEQRQPPQQTAQPSRPDHERHGWHPALCVVVISAAPHAHLLPRVTRSVLASTRLPDQIIVALSGVAPAACAAANASLLPLRAAAPAVEMRLLCTQHARSSGQNRNRGAAACLASRAGVQAATHDVAHGAAHDVAHEVWLKEATSRRVEVRREEVTRGFAAEDVFISFIDSDDLLMASRLERITALMREHRADLGLHSYVGAAGCCYSPPHIITPAEAARLFAAMPQCMRRGFRSRCPPPPTASLACHVNDTCDTSRCAHTSSCIHFLPGSLTRVHYAHATARASVFRHLQQREAAAYGKVEDSWFARDMLALGMRIVVTDEALTYYNRSSGHIQPPGLLKAHPASTLATAGAKQPGVPGAREPPPPPPPPIAKWGSLVDGALDDTILNGSWNNATLQSLLSLMADGHHTNDERHRVLRNRSVLLLGDSTIRDMLSPLTGAQNAEPWRASAGWRVAALGCDERIGAGCPDCWACCMPSCNTAERSGRRIFIPYRKRLANAAYSRRGWMDYEYVHASSATRLLFSWKPEVISRADEAAFAERFCASPPSLVYIGKGMHTACRHNATSLAALEAHVAAAFGRLAQLLRCLPPSSLVVLKTPYFVSNGTLGSSNRICKVPQEEPARVATVRNVLCRLFAEGAFGARALLLDAYAITRAADATGAPALRTLDGHHSPPPVQALEWALLTRAQLAHERGWRPRVAIAAERAERVVGGGVISS